MSLKAHEELKFNSEAELLEQISEAVREKRPLTGKGGLFTPLIKQALEASLEGEIDDHLSNTRGSNNRKNGKIILLLSKEYTGVGMFFLNSKLFAFLFFR